MTMTKIKNWEDRNLSKGEGWRERSQAEQKYQQAFIFSNFIFKLQTISNPILFILFYLKSESKIFEIKIFDNTECLVIKILLLSIRRFVSKLLFKLSLA